MPRLPRHPAQDLQRAASEGEHFFTLSLDMLCIAGFDGYFKRLNPAWTQTLGWSVGELLARPYLDFVHPDDRAATAAEAGKIGTGATAVSFENRYRCKDGSFKWLEWTAVPEPREGLIYAVARDRTDHKTAEEEIDRAHLFLDSIVENIPNMIFVKDARELRFVRFNRAGEQLLGYPRSELLGKNDYDFFPHGEAEFFIQKDREVLKGKQLVDIAEEPLQTRAKGLRYLHTKKLPLLDDAGEPAYLLGISEDITERRQLDAAKSEFIALASHQLRTPLTAIRWSLELLQEGEAPLTANQRKLVDDGSEAARRMANTIQAMLRVSRIESRAVPLHCADVPLAPLLRDLQALHTPESTRKRQTLSTSCPDDLTLHTDPELLGEILSNLIGNALKYTPEGGRVTLTARGGKSITIAVADTGIGIPPGERERVFTKMFRGSNATGAGCAGTGLGLYIASSLAPLLGGGLSLLSREGEGSVFTLTLPASSPDHGQNGADR